MEMERRRRAPVRREAWIAGQYIREF